MMKKILPVLLFLYLPVSAQKMRIISGDLIGLKGIKSYNIKFSYDSLTIGTGIPEQTYLADIKERWEQREPGQGVYFVEVWFSDRKERYEPNFVKNFERFSATKLRDSTAKYTLLVKTKHTEGGWSVGILSNPGGIDGELWIVESADNSKVKARIGFYKFYGSDFSGTDFEMTNRINSAYALAGKGLGYFVKGKSKK